jgi:hypothetical protein
MRKGKSKLDELRDVLEQIAQKYPEQFIEIQQALDIIDKISEAESHTHPDIIKSWWKDLFSRILGSVIGHVLEGSYDDFISNDDM